MPRFLPGSDLYIFPTRNTKMSERNTKTAKELSEEYSLESLQMASSLLEHLKKNDIEPTPEIINAIKVSYEWFSDNLK